MKNACPARRLGLRLLALAPLLLAGCGKDITSPPGTNVDVSLVFDSSVTDPALGSITKLHILGDSGFDETLATGKVLTRTGEFFRYAPKALTVFDLKVTGLAADDTAVAFGSTTVTPIAGKLATATVTMSSSPPDGGGGDVMPMTDGPDAVPDVAGGEAPDGADAADANDAGDGATETPADATPQANGTACSDASGCTSGFCVDGVCCATACTATCHTCAMTGSLGVCVLAQQGTDLRSECPDEGATSCGRSGMCDGTGHCERYARGTICVAQTCDDSTGVGIVTQPAVCDGQGLCNSDVQLKRVCDPYKCDTATQDCLAGCTPGMPECAFGKTCGPTGSCGLKPLGAACATNTECASSVCADGVCCNTNCSAGCQTCTLPQSLGTCVNVPDGDDPKDACAADATNPCGLDGSCDGSGACRTRPVGAKCADSTCAGNVLTQQRTCDGSGVCRPATTTSCGLFNCDSAGTSCLTSCSTGADCSNGMCTMGSCGKQPLGATCSDNSQCTSAKCVDGVCCNSVCAGTCNSCNLPGTAGICKPIPAGQDPDDECVTESLSSCGGNGFCDGAGACAKYDAGTICVNQVCSGHTLTPAATCDGAGTCNPGPTTECTPFTCDAAGSACRLTCADDTQCYEPPPAVAACTGGSCGKKPIGSSCLADTDCNSAHCAPAPDNVCCDTACNGTCESCKLPGRIGSCSPIAAGQTAEAGDCVSDPVATCGKSGLCDGSRGCAKYDNTTQCIPPTCSGSTLVTAGKCDGAGACVAGAGMTCGAYSCSAGGMDCGGTCTTTADCSTGYYCDAGSGSCLLKKAQGTACTIGDDECATGHCAQGFCCDTACTGDCQTCDLPTAAGTCGNVAAGADPKDKCAMTAQSTCGTDGFCDGAGACRLWAIGTTCGSAMCSSPSFTPAPTCNGTGTCVSASPINCSPYACGATGCKTTCSTVSDCAPGVPACTSMSCGLKPLSAACGAGSECNSGKCVDGVCCSSDCTGSCVSCNVAGNAGACTPIPTATDPDSECAADACHDGTCNGASACTVTLGAVCGAKTCADAMDTSTLTCAADGTCTAPLPASCGVYACKASACVAMCNDDTDCAAGNYCLVATHTCLGKLAIGASCSADSWCVSNACSDGVCCNVSCNGVCQQCSSGTCTSYAAGLDPENGCTTANPGLACNGSGACNTTCSMDGQCEAGYYCAAPNCQPKRPLGQACSGATQCASGNCVDGTCCSTATCGGTQTCANPEGVCKTKLGQSCSADTDCTYTVGAGNCVDKVGGTGVCCNNSCVGVCVSCSLPSTKGTCTNIPAGADPDAECLEGFACKGDGSCVSGSCTTSLDCEAAFQCLGGTCAALPSVIPPGKLFPMQFNGGGYEPGSNSNRSTGSGHELSMSIGDPSPICAMSPCGDATYEVVFGFLSTSSP